MPTSSTSGQVHCGYDLEDNNPEQAAHLAVEAWRDLKTRLDQLGLQEDSFHYHRPAHFQGAQEQAGTGGSAHCTGHAQSWY